MHRHSSGGKTLATSVTICPLTHFLLWKYKDLLCNYIHNTDQTLWGPAQVKRKSKVRGDCESWHLANIRASTQAVHSLKGILELKACSLRRVLRHKIEHSVLNTQKCFSLESVTGHVNISTGVAFRVGPYFVPAPYKAKWRALLRWSSAPDLHFDQWGHMLNRLWTQATWMRWEKAPPTLGSSLSAKGTPPCRESCYYQGIIISLIYRWRNWVRKQSGASFQCHRFGWL